MTRAQLADAITDPQVLYRRFDGIRASEKLVDEAKSRVQSAEKALQAARLDESMGAQEKAASINAAQRGRRIAQADLDHATGPEEMRKLREGYELHILSQAMLMVQGRLDAARTHVKKWSIYLKWIDDQYSAIATECGYHVEGSVADREQPLRRSSRRPHTQPTCGTEISSKTASTPAELSRIMSTQRQTVGLPALDNRRWTIQCFRTCRWGMILEADPRRTQRSQPLTATENGRLLRF